MSTGDEGLSQCHSAENTYPRQQRWEKLIKMWCISGARHTSYSTERRSAFYVLKTVGADAVTGSRESSRKHKYKITVTQECLGALWQREDKGSSQHSTKIRHQGKVWIYESHQLEKKPETWISLTTTVWRFFPCGNYSLVNLQSLFPVPPIKIPWEIRSFRISILWGLVSPGASPQPRGGKSPFPDQLIIKLPSAIIRKTLLATHQRRCFTSRPL